MLFYVDTKKNIFNLWNQTNYCVFYVRFKIQLYIILINIRIHIKILFINTYCMQIIGWNDQYFD